MSPLDPASLDSSLDDVRSSLLAARGIRARLLALRDRAGSAARALEGDPDDLLADLPAGKLEGVARQLEAVAGRLERLCGRLSL
jgi:hypothetical protein